MWMPDAESRRTILDIQEGAADDQGRNRLAACNRLAAGHERHQIPVSHPWSTAKSTGLHAVRITGLMFRRGMHQTGVTRFVTRMDGNQGTLRCLEDR
jgi:hypothetical protein